MVFCPIGDRSLIRTGMLALIVIGALAGCTGPGHPTKPALTISDDNSVHRLPATESHGPRTLELMKLAEWGSGDISNGWGGDEFLLTVTTDGGQKVLEAPFFSSYGDFQIDLVDLTGDGCEEYVFVVGDGRGTSARREHLIVKQERNSQLVEILSIVRSDYFGSGVTWWYDCEYIDLNRDGITDVRLTLDHSPTDITSLQAPEDIPSEQVKVYRWDPRSGLMRLAADKP